VLSSSALPPRLKSFFSHSIALLFLFLSLFGAPYTEDPSSHSTGHMKALLQKWICRYCPATPHSMSQNKPGVLVPWVYLYLHTFPGPDTNSKMKGRNLVSDIFRHLRIHNFSSSQPDQTPLNDVPPDGLLYISAMNDICRPTSPPTSNQPIFIGMRAFMRIGWKCLTVAM